jgi:hypothetical protein
MRLLAAMVLVCAAVGVRPIHAQDRLSVFGELDMRLVSASGGSSFMDGGLGTLRFDSEHDGLRFGHALLASRLRINDILTMHADVYAYGDHDRNVIDLSEAWIEARPFPSQSVRWSARAGAFFLPVSLENRGPGWSDVYTITPSALNTWTGEEFRTVGTEFEARWLGASRDYVGDVALVAALYGWNDPAGVLLAARGFALTDRPSTLFGGLGRPRVNFYHEVDHRPGYYTGLTWRHHDRLEVRALHYDNLADASATTGSAFAWRTRFTSVGARLEPTAPWTFIAQYLDGDTAVGPNSVIPDQLRMTYRVGFLLSSWEWKRERLTLRFDDFRTHQTSGFFGPPSDDLGHAWTFGWTHDFGERWQIAAEGIRVTSRFPPRATIGESVGLVESQLQIAFRYRFYWPEIH